MAVAMPSPLYKHGRFILDSRRASAHGPRGECGEYIRRPCTVTVLTMNRQPVDLGYVLRQLPQFEFSMHDFDHRLRFQKLVYLLQAFDVYMGYDYSWYLRGPYCSTLAASGFALDGFYEHIPKNVRMVFASPLVNGRFEDFKRRIKDHENDTAFLEIAASLHFLDMGGKLARDEVLRRVVNKRPEFTEDMCVDIRSLLEKDWKILGGGVGGHDPATDNNGNGCAYGTEMECDPALFVPEIPSDMDRRPYDQGFYHMLLDSREGNEKIALVGRDVFRKGQRRPPVDEITVDDTELLVRLHRRG